MPAPASRLSSEAGFTLLRCPACATAEPVPTADLADAVRLIACGKCGASFPMRELRRARRGSARALKSGDGALRAAPASRPPDERAGGDIRAQAVVRAAARMPKRRLQLIGAALASALLAAAFVLGREAATAAAPDLSGLHAAIGLAAERAGLHVEDLAAERDGTSLALRGRLVNATRRKMVATDLAVEMQDAAGRVTSVTLVPAPAPLLEPDTAAGFAYRLDDVPADVATVRVRPSGGWAQPEPAATGARP